MKAAIGYVLIALVLAAHLYVYWVMGVLMARKFGLTRRMTMLDNSTRWVGMKLIGRCPDDFGEFRGRKFRETHRQ
jgi:hypothetical protein